MAFTATIIFGPTASGKTSHAYTLAREQKADILSFDSRHVYRGMDIVTGKDLDANFEGQVYGVDLVTPDQEFSIHHYYEYAAPIVEQHKQAHTPLILVGGSWLYAQTLIEPPASLSAPVDLKLRDELAQTSLDDLQAQLQALNPTRWNAMNASDRLNPRRLIRAIEIAMNPECGDDAPAVLTDFSMFLLDPEMETIESNIRQRVDERWNQGALEETKRLMAAYPDWSGKAFSSTGYRVIRQFLEGKLSESESKEAWVLEERQYAKRQKTWVKAVRSRQAKHLV